jgi:hypothetical protein
MDNDDYSEPNFYSEPEQEPESFEAPRRRFNPARRNKPRLIRGGVRKPKQSRHLPVKSVKEMSVRKARRLLFGGRTPGRPSRSLSAQLKQAKRVLQSAGEPLRRKTKPSLRGRGRPKKLIVTKKEKRPRGRPKKNPPAVAKPKRPRGRPRKPIVTSNKIARPRGRPRKNPLQQLVDDVKKRPRKNSDEDLT